eukprot:10339332-Lingulodinium_polyedra.AAC.1
MYILPFFNYERAALQGRVVEFAVSQKRSIVEFQAQVDSAKVVAGPKRTCAELWRSPIKVADRRRAP